MVDVEYLLPKLEELPAELLKPVEPSIVDRFLAQLAKLHIELVDPEMPCDLVVHGPHVGTPEAPKPRPTFATVHRAWA